MNYLLLLTVLVATAKCQDITGIIQDITNIFYNLPVAFLNCTNTVVLRSHLTYTLYTQENPDNGIILIDSNLDQVNPNNRVIFGIHGWLQNAAGDMIQMKNAYLQKGPANVILLDWSFYALNLYGASVCSVPPIGIFTGNLISALGVNLNKITINGFSFGAQIAGYAGQQVQSQTGGSKIARINGLDAAGPGYLGLPINQRLDPTDAQFVQGIHTSNNQFGYTPVYATADFQVNCGAIQTGCPLSPTISPNDDPTDIRTYLSRFFCNHVRALTYFIESILTGNFIGVNCNNCVQFTSNLCRFKTGTTMGEDCLSTAQGEYFLSTNAISPFARGNAGKGII